MNNKNAGFGVFLLSIGILWLLITFGIVDWSIIGALFKLWPLVFVVIGINVIFRGKEYIKIITWLLFLAVLVVYSLYNSNPFSTGKVIEGNTIQIAKMAETKQAVFNLGTGGSRLEIGASEQNLVDGVVTDNGIRYDVRYVNNRENAAVDIKKKESSYIFHPGSNMRECRLNLNKDVLWNADLKLGAVDGNIDLSQLKIKRLDVNVGAGKLDFKLGNLCETTDVTIHAGASKLALDLPKSSGVKIKVNGALNSTNLESLGFDRQGSYYVSPNYEGAAGKLNIDVEMGVGKLDVDWK